MKIKILDIAVFVFALVIAGSVRLLPKEKGQNPHTVVITFNGEEQRISLPANENINVNGVEIVIEDYTAFVKSSDCPDKTCVKTGVLKEAGQRAVCLPNRVIVYLEGGGVHAVVG